MLKQVSRFFPTTKKKTYLLTEEKFLPISSQIYLSDFIGSKLASYSANYAKSRIKIPLVVKLDLILIKSIAFIDSKSAFANWEYNDCALFMNRTINAHSSAHIARMHIYMSAIILAFLANDRIEAFLSWIKVVTRFQ